MRPKNPESISIFSFRSPAATACPARRRAARRRPRRARTRSSASATRGRDRLLAVDVLARGDRAADELGPQSGRRGIEVDRVVARWRARIEIGGPALDAVRLRERLDLGGVASDEDRVGHDARPPSSATPPCARIALIERTRCWLVPMRPVTPFMMMPSRIVFHARLTLRRACAGTGRAPPSNFMSDHEDDRDPQHRGDRPREERQRGCRRTARARGAVPSP